jgi:magnesium transporter
MAQGQRVFHVRPDGVVELEGLPGAIPEAGYLWVAVNRSDFEMQVPLIQDALQRLCGGQLVDLHLSDLINAQLPSHFDSTSWYDVMVFRRLAALGTDGVDDQGRVTLPSVDTSAVAMAVFDRLLLSVHPETCQVRDFFATRLTQTLIGSPPSSQGEGMRGTARLPQNPADQMLRMVNHIVDGYLDLRRRLTRKFADLQQLLMDPSARFNDWSVVLNARTMLHTLEDICEDQRGAVQEWIDALDEWPAERSDAARRERELLRVRSRDVLEHIERVLGHVRRLEQSAEAAVQMHFSAVGHRTNQIMRTLTVLTAIFLPLNLITGFFGMNLQNLPLSQQAMGVWIVLAMMVVVGLGLAVHFWRKRYLSSRG